MFGASREFPLEGDLQSDLYAFPGAVLWSAAPYQPGVTPPRSGAGQIQELDLTTGSLRTTYTASSLAASVSDRASADWSVWLEATDNFGFSDGRLLAAPRRGGATILIDDLSQHPNRILFPMWTVDGSDLYWTVPATSEGRPFGELKHKRLPSGPIETTVSALPGQIIALPSAYAGSVAYELRSDRDQPRVVLRKADASTLDVAVPGSEPTVGDGFVAFKRAPVGVDGTLAAFLIDSGRTVELGVGEQPRAGGAWLSWARRPEPGGPSPYAAVFVSQRDFRCVAQFVRPTPNGNSSISLPAFGGGNAAWILSDYDAPQLQRHTLVIEEIRDLRC